MRNKLLLLSILISIGTLFPTLSWGQGILTPANGSSITIISGNSYQVDGVAGTNSFNGTIDGTGITLQALTIAATVTDKPVINLKNVVTSKFTVQAAAEVIIQIQGENKTSDLGEIVNDGDLFIMGPQFNFSQTKDAVNRGFFTDSTATIHDVTGEAPLIIGLTEGGESHNSEPVELLQVVVAEKTQEVTFILQKLVTPFYWMDMDTAVVTAYNPIIRHYRPVEQTGQYRFRVITAKETSSTSLISNAVEVNVYHNIVIPEIKGAKTDPAAGTHEVLGGTDFRFSVILDEGYDKSNPAVYASPGDQLLTQTSTGEYVIKAVDSSMDIRVEGVVPNNPSSNTGIDKNDFNLYSENGTLYIESSVPAYAKIYSITGVLHRTINVSNGFASTALDPGIYIVQMNNKAYKVAVRR